MHSGIRWTMNIMKAQNTFSSSHTPSQAPSHPETVGLCGLSMHLCGLSEHLCGLSMTDGPTELCNVCVCFIPVSLWLWEISIACLSVIDSIFFFFAMYKHSSVQFSRSVVSDSLPPMDCSTPGLPVHHQLSEFTQTHVHRVSDAIQPSYPLLSPSPPTFNLSQYPDLF